MNELDKTADEGSRALQEITDLGIDVAGSVGGAMIGGMVGGPLGSYPGAGSGPVLPVHGKVTRIPQHTSQEGG